MLLDIEVRDAVDAESEPPAHEPEMYSPEYGLIDLALWRIQTADPAVVNEMLGPEDLF